MAEIIDINVSKVVENVQITTTENITTVNINEVAGSGASWGAISGKLSNQTDLQDALDLKANVSELGATAFSNDYNDLANKPNIPTLTSQLTNNSGFITNVITALGFTPENVANKATNLTSPDNTKYPTTLAVVNENKKATITVELINSLTTNFYAPNALRINSTALINGSGTIALKVNDVAYTLGNLIAQGAKITVETTTASVYNLIVIYE